MVSEAYQILDEKQEETPEQQWLMAHCQEYGFILRYPSDKTEETGIIYEPWHYRYVGQEAAREMMERGICLEEYLEERARKNEDVAFGLGKRYDRVMIKILIVEDERPISN